jgi:flagellar motor component MotA
VLTTLYARQAVQQHDTGKPRPSLLTDQLAADPGSATIAAPPPALPSIAPQPATAPEPVRPPAAAPEPVRPPAAAPEPVRPPPAAALKPPPLPPSPAPNPRPSPPTVPPGPVQPVPVVPASPSLARTAPRRSTPWVRDPAAVGARLAEWIDLVRRDGPLALDAQEVEIEVSSSLGRHLRLGVELVVDQAKPETAQERLDAHAEGEAAALAAALDYLTEGIIAIQAGAAPAELAQRLGVTLTPRDAARLARAIEGAAEPETWLDDPVSAIGAMTAWCRIAQRSGLVALEAAAAALDASTDVGEHAHRGLMLIVDGQDPALVRDVLETNRDTVVAAFRQAAAMVDAGLWYVQNELPPGAATDALAVFLAPHDRARFRALATRARGV